MVKSFGLITFVFLAIGTAIAVPSSRIVNGTDATIEEFGFMVRKKFGKF